MDTWHLDEKKMAVPFFFNISSPKSHRFSQLCNLLLSNRGRKYRGMGKKVDCVAVCSSSNMKSSNTSAVLLMHKLRFHEFFYERYINRKSIH